MSIAAVSEESEKATTVQQCNGSAGAASLEGATVDAKSDASKGKTDNNSNVVKSQKQDNDDQSSAEIEIVWKNVFLIGYLHLAGIVGLYMLLFQAKVLTFIYTLVMAIYSGMGITAGAHRLWAHKCYKAKLPFRIFLAIANTLAGQNSIHEWSRDHRVHHKFTETHADPHNARRGFFFSHVGWLLCKKHQDVRDKGKSVDMSDLLEDPVVVFQMNYYKRLVFLVSFVLCPLPPILLWNEDPIVAYFTTVFFRYAVTLNGTWLVNSAAHMWGNRPYDKYINPVENATVAFLAFGEGWHNYHHVFPWDYKTAELGDYSLNWTKILIDFMKRIGQAYDLKTVNPELIRKRMLRTGDGTTANEWTSGYGSSGRIPPADAKTLKRQGENAHHEELHTHIWGWDDTDRADVVAAEDVIFENSSKAE